MTHSNKISMGFSIVEVGISLFVMLLIGALAYVGYAQFTQNSSDQKDQTSSTPQTTKKYVTIKEWGVRIPYAGDDTFSYTMSDSLKNEEDGKWIILVSKKLGDRAEGCKEYGAGGVMRFALEDTVPGFMSGSDNATAEQMHTTASESYIKLGNYVYTFTPDNASCSFGSEQGEDPAYGQIGAAEIMRLALPKIEAIPAE